jgi:hypothetical protein
MDVTNDYTAQNLRARQRDVMNLILRGLFSKEIASILNLAEGLTAKECLQNAEVCLALLARLRNSTRELSCLKLHSSSAPWLSIWSVTSASGWCEPVCKNRPGRGQVESDLSVKTTTHSSIFAQDGVLQFDTNQG